MKVVDELFRLAGNKPGAFIVHFVEYVKSCPGGLKCIQRVYGASVACTPPMKILFDAESTDISAEHFVVAGKTKVANRGTLPFTALSQWLMLLISRGALWDPSVVESATDEYFHRTHQPVPEEESTDVELRPFCGAVARDLAAWVQLTHGCARTCLQTLAFQSYMERSRELDFTAFAWHVRSGLALAGVKLVTPQPELAVKHIYGSALYDAATKTLKGPLTCLWQPGEAKIVQAALATTKAFPLLGSEPDELYHKSRSTSPSSADDNETTLYNDDLPFWSLGGRCAQYASEGDRSRHRHGACLYLRLELFREREDQLGALARSMRYEEAVFCYGRNTEVFTKGWKNLNKEDGTDQMERWKVLHAEIDCLLQMAADENLQWLLAPVAGRDIQTFGREQLAVNVFPEQEKEVEPERLQLHPKLEAFLAELKRAYPTTDSLWPEDGALCPVGAVIVEMSNNCIGYDSSQACPLCIKGLKRWGIGRQTFSVDAQQLFQSEPITPNENLVCESLRSALTQLTNASSNTWKRNSYVKKKAAQTAA